MSKTELAELLEQIVCAVPMTQEGHRSRARWCEVFVKELLKKAKEDHE